MIKHVSKVAPQKEASKALSWVHNMISITKRIGDNLEVNW